MPRPICCPQVPPVPKKQPSGYECVPRGKLRSNPPCLCNGSRLACREKPKIYTCTDRRLNTNCSCCFDF